jgi:hypothetical protein
MMGTMCRGNCRDWTAAQWEDSALRSLCLKFFFRRSSSAATLETKSQVARG